VPAELGGDEIPRVRELLGLAAPQRLASRGDDDRGLAPSLVRHADHDGIGETRNAAHQPLDPIERDVDAAGDDHVVGTTVHPHDAVVVEPEIAGVIPADAVLVAREVLRRELPVAEIAVSEHRTGDAQLSVDRAHGDGVEGDAVVDASPARLGRAIGADESDAEIGGAVAQRFRQRLATHEDRPVRLKGRTHRSVVSRIEKCRQLRGDERGVQLGDAGGTARQRAEHRQRRVGERIGREPTAQRDRVRACHQRPHDDLESGHVSGGQGEQPAPAAHSRRRRLGTRPQRLAAQRDPLGDPAGARGGDHDGRAVRHPFRGVSEHPESERRPAVERARQSGPQFGRILGIRRCQRDHVRLDPLSSARGTRSSRRPASRGTSRGPRPLHRCRRRDAWPRPRTPAAPRARRPPR